MAKNYKDNFDYSEAIANTQNAAERQQLLTERQNKINAEGLAGKVASNEAVSTWNGDYRPYSVSSGGGGGGRSNGGSGSSSSVSSAIAELYAAAESARLQRFEAARTFLCNSAFTVNITSNSPLCKPFFLFRTFFTDCRLQFTRPPEPGRCRACTNRWLILSGRRERRSMSKGGCEAAESAERGFANGAE